MATKRPAKRSHTKTSEPISWLPVDSRLIPDVFRFGKVTGVARVFLMLEMILASVIVVGSVALAMVTVLSK